MSDEEIQAEPVFDEFILARQAEIAEYEDRLQKSKAELKELRAAADERDRARADARFAEARHQHPHLSVHQIAAMLDDPEPRQFASAQHVNAVET